jgi:hypothetical protein
MMIDGSGIRIRSCHQAPLDTLETPVIALGGGQDRPQRVAKRIKGNNVRVGNSWHCWSSEEGKRGNSYW